MVALKYFYCHFVKRLVLQNTNTNSFVVINNGVMVLNLKSVVPVKTWFVHDERHSALHKCKERISLFNKKNDQTASNSVRNYGRPLGELEVKGSIPGCEILKSLKNGTSCSSLRLRDRARTGRPSVRIMRLGVVSCQVSGS